LVTEIMKKAPEGAFFMGILQWIRLDFSQSFRWVY